jgi:hypothetical protein
MTDAGPQNSEETGMTDARPQSSEEAAEIVQNDPTLAVATHDAEDDAATDDDARTPDASPVGDQKD